MTAIDFGSEHEALRYFRGLSPTEREEHLWMGLRELATLGQGMIERQDKTNGTVTKTKDELAVHLEMHKLELNEVDFVKRWGKRGTELLGVIIALSAVLIAAAAYFTGGG